MQSCLICQHLLNEEPIAQRTLDFRFELRAYKTRDSQSQQPFPTIDRSGTVSALQRGTKPLVDCYLRDDLQNGLNTNIGDIN